MLGRTFGRVDVHGGFLDRLRLRLLDGLEELCVDAGGTVVFDGLENAGTQLCAVRLLDAGAEAFRHCDGVLWGFLGAEGREVELEVVEVERRPGRRGKLEGPLGILCEVAAWPALDLGRPVRPASEERRDDLRPAQV